MAELGQLSAEYESNGDPACVSSGINDAGGISYGTYQLASNCGSVDAFLGWGLKQGGFYTDYARALIDSGEINSDGFIAKWQELGTFDAVGFEKMQHDYIKSAYYDVACEYLRQNMFNVEKHSDALKDVVWSRAVQYGTGEIVNMFNDALKLMEKALNIELPNLSYIDDKRFDYDLIAGIYDTCMSLEWNSSALRESLNNRFADEKFKALKMLMEEVEGV
jgi:hypothetical protein